MAHSDWPGGNNHTKIGVPMYFHYYGHMKSAALETERGGWRTPGETGVAELSCSKPGRSGFLVNCVAENWCGGAVLRSMHILEAESSMRAAQIDLNPRNVLARGEEPSGSRPPLTCCGVVWGGSLGALRPACMTARLRPWRACWMDSNTSQILPIRIPYQTERGSWGGPGEGRLGQRLPL